VDDSNNQIAGAWPKNMMAKVVPGDLKFTDYNKDGLSIQWINTLY